MAGALSAALLGAQLFRDGAGAPTSRALTRIGLWAAAGAWMGHGAWATNQRVVERLLKKQQELEQSER